MTSVFETNFWFWVDPPALESAEIRCLGYTKAFKTLMQLFALLPRLVTMIRRAMSGEFNRVNLRDARSMVSQLVQDYSIEGFVQGSYAANSMYLVPTSNRSLKLLLPNSHHFVSPQMYQFTMLHGISRLVLCGCIQRLAVRQSPNFCPLNIYTTYIENATVIMISFEYCQQLDRETLPCAWVTQLRALKFAFGAWHRLLADSSTAQELEKLRHCLSMINEIEAYFSREPSSRDKLIQFMEWVTGGDGPQPAELYTKVLRYV